MIIESINLSRIVGLRSLDGVREVRLHTATSGQTTKLYASVSGVSLAICDITDVKDSIDVQVDLSRLIRVTEGGDLLDIKVDGSVLSIITDNDAEFYIQTTETTIEPGVVPNESRRVGAMVDRDGSRIMARASQELLTERVYFDAQNIVVTNGLVVAWMPNSGCFHKGSLPAELLRLFAVNDKPTAVIGGEGNCFLMSGEDEAVVAVQSFPNWGKVKLFDWDPALILNERAWLQIEPLRGTSEDVLRLVHLKHSGPRLTAQVDEPDAWAVRTLDCDVDSMQSGLKECWVDYQSLQFALRFCSGGPVNISQCPEALMFEGGGNTVVVLCAQPQQEKVNDEQE